jgi:hypothetical protein
VTLKKTLPLQYGFLPRRPRVHRPQRRGQRMLSNLQLMHSSRRMHVTATKPVRLGGRPMSRNVLPRMLKTAVLRASATQTARQQRYLLLPSLPGASLP